MGLRSGRFARIVRWDPRLPQLPRRRRAWGPGCGGSGFHRHVIAERDTPAVAQIWFQGLNPILDDGPPALLLREGELSGVGPKVLAAARQFAAVG